MHKLKVLFYPDNSGMNPYITIIKKTLRDYKDIIIEPFVYNEKYYWGNKHEVDIVYLNWYENVQTESLLRTLIRALRRLELVHFIKSQEIKVVVVIHNRVPHNAKNTRLIKWFSEKLYDSADGLVILSGATLEMLKNQFGEKFYNKNENKIYHVPHPDYYDVYESNNIDYRKKFSIGKDDFVCLFFGSIAPYKNVELVIEAAKKLASKYKDIKFVIAGGCDTAYEENITKQIGNNKSIIFAPQRLKDDELMPLIDSSNVVVMPLDIRSSLNSTTFYLTITCRKNIVCPRIASAQDFNTDNLYLYDYSDKNEHLEKLVLTIDKAYSDYSFNPEAFDKKVSELSMELSNKNSKKIIGKKLYEVFDNVINKKR